MRAVLTLLGLASAWCTAAAVAAQEPEAAQAEPAEVSTSEQDPSGEQDPQGEVVQPYGDLESVRARLAALAAAQPAASRLFELGVSGGGRPLWALEFGHPDGGDLAARPTIWLVGGLDGTSLAGGEAVLAAARELTADPDSLPVDLAFVALPWASPDALERRARGECVDGRNDRPVDDDGDGAVGEDRPDDLDGDGLVLEMLLPDPEGAWTPGEDPRFLVPAREGDSPRYARVPEGRDDDGDGRFNEDGTGGVVLDRNFPVGWRGASGGGLSGRLPLSEPGARILAEAALARRTAAALFFQGAHGRLATPGGCAEPVLPFERDQAAFGRLASIWSRVQGVPGGPPPTLSQAREADAEGAAVDWFYAALGALTAELSVWGPDLPVDEGAAGAQRLVSEGDAARPPLSATQRAWSRWLDDRRGGHGFVEWHPVELGEGLQALVGGWEPYTCHNPPPEELGTALEGLPQFVREVGRAMPRLEFVQERSERRGELLRLALRVRNAGSLPSGLFQPAGAGPYGLHLTLELPVGARLLAGQSELWLGHLAGGAVSEELEWLILAPADATFRALAVDDWTAEVDLEVRH